MILIKSELHKKSIATAMTWQVLDPFGNSLLGHKQLIEYIKTGGYIGISYKNGTDINLGVGRDLHLDLEHEHKIISIAYQIALHAQMREKSLVVFLKNTISQDESIFAVGLINGNVVIDQLIEANELDQIVNDFSKINIFTTTNIEIYGDAAPENFSIAKPFTLEELLNDAAHQKKYVEALKNSLMVFYFVLSLIVVLIVYFFYGLWQDNILSGESALSNKLKTINSPESVYTQRIQVFLKTPLPLAKDNISSALSEIGAFPFVYAKWRVQSIQCENGICLVNWNSVGGSYQDFIQNKAPSWSNIHLQSNNASLLGDMNALQSSFTLESKKALLPSLADIPKLESFTFSMADLLRQLQSKGWESTLKSPVQIEMPNDGAELLSIKNHPMALMAIPWSAQTQGWRETEMALKDFGDICTLESLKLEFNNQRPLLSTNGRCYVKK